MKITFLGTGTSQGVPVIGCQCKVCQSADTRDNRLRSSLMLEFDDKRYIIDSGPDFRAQMLRKNISKIDGILYTHEHADHTAGLDDIRPLYFSRNKPVPIYAQQRVIDDLRRRFDYIFRKENRYPGAPEVAVNIVEETQSFQLAGKSVIPIPVLHGSLPILGYRIADVAYITDAKTIPKAGMDLLQDLDVLIINALHHRPHKMHMNLKESLAIIAKLHPKKAYLVHVSHHMGLHGETEKKLPENVVMAYDGLTIDL